MAPVCTEDVVGSHQFEEVTEMAAMNAASVKVAKDEDASPEDPEQV